VLEAEETIGGGCRSAELTLPGFVHDVCSAFHPWPLASPFLRTLPLDQHGLELIQPPAPLAHPFDDGTAVVLERSVEATAALLGSDGDAYCKLFRPLAAGVDDLVGDLLGPLRPPRHPIADARFALRAVRSAAGLARSAFDGEQARALFAGMAAHGMVPLDQTPTAAFGLMLGAVGHAHGWPIARGGSQSVVDALTSYLRSRGGEIETRVRVESLDELPPARAVLFDVTPRQLARIAGELLRPATATGSSGSATAPVRSRSTGRSTARSPGAPRSASAPAQCISPARWMRSSPPRRRLRAASRPRSRTCCSASRASSIAPAPPRARTRSGRTATCRTAPTST
jgi:phytoene dehydrogenase-like protein